MLPLATRDAKESEEIERQLFVCGDKRIVGQID
jgi:hypothetical protein